MAANPKAPVVDNPEAEADLEVVGGGFQAAVAQAHDLRADPLDACLGMLASELVRPVEHRSADSIKPKG